MGGSVLSALSELTGIVVFLALLVIFLRTRSPWILAALLAEAVTLVMRVAFKFLVDYAQIRDVLIGVWQLAALVMAACLLGYAINLPPLRRGDRSEP